ncbi:sensor histidine kinase [Novilysobacter arseniciresistens]|uniref:sensor histidine kinase n=1 Tax=Novilysobacter arseniciresistens TaxID=1385522 RepID=UPI000AA2512B|nr:sensor histidine kinase [Lysobacter arseniciresistens]
MPAATATGGTGGWRARLRRLSIRHQLWALFGLFLLAGATVLVIDEIAQYRARQSLLALKDDSLLRMRRLKAVSDAYGLAVVDTTFRVRNALIGWDEGVAAVDEARAGIDREWRALAAMPRSGDQQRLFAEVAAHRAVADAAVARLRGILLARDIGALGRFADTALYPAIDPVTGRIQALSDLAMVEADALVRADLARNRQVSVLRIGLSLLALLLVALIGRTVLRNAYQGVEALTFLARRMREHDYTAMPRHAPRGELATVMEAFTEMRRDVLDFETELIDQLARNEATLDANRRLQDELRESEARAQAANHAKSAFLASMSHEIRTPMIGVTGMIEVLAHTRLEPDQRRALNVIQQSSQSLLQIIGDILDFSKIEADRLELAPEPLRLDALVRATTANYAGAASSKGLGLDCTIDPRVAPAYLGDPLRLRQVLSNFLSNAIKFTAQGEVRVALEWLGEAGPATDGTPRDRLALHVTDTGIGIAPEAQARLFQPFSQGEDDTTRRFGGTGLGLVICERLARLMGGEVTMDSAPGRGTTMRVDVVLPRAALDDVAAEPADDDAPVPFSARAVPDVARAERERSLVLLVDDHPTNRLVIARQLALAGYASESAEDGAEALQRWRGGRYALLLSDVHMPRLDGYQLARAIRKEEARDVRVRTPIVALTASALKGEAERCLGAGMDDYLAKPVSVPVLQACLQRWLPHTAGAAADADPASDADETPVAGDPAGSGAVEADIPADARDAAPILDGHTLQALTGGDPAETRALLADFLDSTRRDLAELDRVLVHGDTVGLARQAHKIKGAARLVGATALADAAAALEAAARSDTLDDPAPLANALRDAVARLHDHAASQG